MGFEPPGGVLAPAPTMVSKRDSQRPIGDMTGPGHKRDGRARVPQRAAGLTTRRGPHNAPRIPQRAAGMSQTPRDVAADLPRVCHTRREASPPTCRGLSGNAARRGSHGVPLTCARIAASRGRQDTPPGRYHSAPRLGTRQRLVQRYLPSGPLAPVNALARAPTNARWACPNTSGRGTTRVPRPAIQLRAARSFSARTRTRR